MPWKFELVAGPYGGMTDGPLWDGSGLLFSNQHDEAIMRYDPASGQTTVFRPYWIRVKGLALAPDGTLYGCQSGSRRIVCFNADGSATPVRARLDGELHNCPDDLAIDRQGRIWFSDPYDPVPPRGPDIRPFLDHASVLRLERPHPEGEGASTWAPEGERATAQLADGAGGETWLLQRMTFDTRWPRGVLLSADEQTLYVTESNDESAGPRELRAYEIRDDGSLRPYRIVYRFGVDEKDVDGMCLDDQGNVLVCAGSPWGPGAIFVVTPGGDLLATHSLPEGQPTNCTFGDADGATLYVTTVEGHLYRVRDAGD